MRERRDVDLILGQGSFAAGWHTHHFSQAGLFLISDREHTVSQRARGYLVTDDHVSSYAAAYARHRPRLQGRNDEPNGPQSPQTPEPGPAHGDDRVGPETALWDALTGAGPEGISVTELVTACGMGRRWVYYRLREHAAAGRAVQVRRGWWRALPPGDGRPPPRPAPGRPPNRTPRR